MFSAEHEKNAQDTRRGHFAMWSTHEHALPPAHSCSSHGENNIIKGKSTALTTVQLRSCKHQQLSSLIWVFNLVLYFSQHLLKIKGKKEETNVYGTSTCSGSYIESFNPTQFEVTCVCMPLVACLILLHLYSRFVISHSSPLWTNN